MRPAHVEPRQLASQVHVLAMAAGVSDSPDPDASDFLLGSDIDADGDR